MLSLAAWQQAGWRWSSGLPRSELATGEAAAARTRTGLRMASRRRTGDGVESLGGRWDPCAVDLRSSRGGRRGIVGVMDRAESEPDGSEMSGMMNREDADESVPEAKSGFHGQINKASKWIAAVLGIAAVLWRHDEEAMWFATGAVVNGGLCKLLKRLLNESRPQTAAGIKSDPGMPSSHAQGLAYLGTYAAAVLLLWQGPNAWAILGAAGFTCSWVYGSWLRISEGLHTVPQVVVGNALGVAFALGWLFLWTAVVGAAVHSSEVLRYVLVALFTVAALVLYFVSIKNWKLGEK